MDSKKVKIEKTNNKGSGIFAVETIRENELIAEFDGEIYGWHDPRWTDDLYDHCIQFEEKKWRDSKGIARLINHSCEPNCGVKNLFQIVAMREILPGEEITWDYEMTERHPYWRMKCKCGNSNCRMIIGNFENMPADVRKKYTGYISEWLLN